jgi:hypothetical protein
LNQWRKGTASWTIKDTLYLSVVFSWDMPEALRIAKASKKRVVIGGPAAKLAGIQTETLPYSALPFHNPLATFTTRGCPNKCAFCAVPIIEGDLVELTEWQPRPVVCDNNLLAATQKHFDSVIDNLKSMPYVDFNQGLDSDLFTDHHARQMGELKAVKVRFAFDTVGDETSVIDAIGRARAHGLTDIGVYVLIGFHDTPEDATYRLEKVRSLGIWPNIMRYQPLRADVKDSYVGSKWTQVELENMTRYYSRLRYLEHIPYADYKGFKNPNQEALI